MARRRAAGTAATTGKEYVRRKPHAAAGAIRGFRRSRCRGAWAKHLIHKTGGWHNRLYIYRNSAASGNRLAEGGEKSFHLGFFPDGEPHIVRHGWEEPANFDFLFLHGRYERRHGTFHIEHDEIRL